MQPTLCDPHLARRAIHAYHRACSRVFAVFQQPTAPDCWKRRDGTQYIVLSNTRGLLAVYRLRPDGVRLVEVEVQDVPASIRRVYC